MTAAARSTPGPRTATCVICSSGDVQRRGTIYHPVPPRVAGCVIDLGDEPFFLERCRRCQFQFKSPSIPQDKLEACYERSSDDHWEADPDPYRRRFDLLLSLLSSRAPGRRVLDVGCHNGALLAFMGPDWSRFGVEPSVAAAAKAGARGATILGATLQDLDERPDQFDAIACIDVLEHLTDPMAVFARVARLLSPGGVALFSTGDTDAWSARLQGSRYWYYSLPEHVSFYCRTTMEFVASQTGLKLAHYSRHSHDRFGAVQRLTELGKNLAYSATVAVRGLGVPSLKSGIVGRRAPGWMSARDHFFCVLQKPA